MAKLKLGLYWAAACGGCDIAVLDVHEKILDIAKATDLVFWPVALDIKYKDVKAYEDKFIDVTLFHGAIRNSEHEEIAHLLRRKSKTMVAFGSCACFGGIPGLANFTNCEEIFERAYKTTPSTVNPQNTIPKQEYKAKEGSLFLPAFWNTVKTLAQVIEVEYFIPGCPPPSDLVMTAVNAIVSGDLPPPGSVIAGTKTLCDECEREKEAEKKIEKFRTISEFIPDSKRCLLDQGVLCMGPATRSGCGMRCINANMPCRGCFGPTDEVDDFGAKAMTAIASIIAANEEDKIKEIIKDLKDPASIFYRFTLPHSGFKRRIMKKQIC
jgi:F420-non-reducing hydrogenase small subunit